MKKQTTKQQNAPSGVATNEPLHYSCMQCTHFGYGFEIPYCYYLEREISDLTLKHVCLHFDLFISLEDLPF